MKRLLSFLLIFSILVMGFISCSAPAGGSSTTSTSESSGSDGSSGNGSGDGSGTGSGDGSGNISGDGSGNIPGGETNSTVSADRTSATGVNLDSMLSPIEWKVSATQAVPYAQLGTDRAIYIQVDPAEAGPASWGTWAYSEATKEFTIHSAGKLFFDIDAKGMWTGKLILDTGEVLSPFVKK